MKWFKKINYNDIPKLPDVKSVSSEIISISEYLDAFKLPEIFKQVGADTLPVIDIQGNVVGIVSEYDLAQILPEWSFDPESYKNNVTVEDIMTRNVWVETENTNIKDILSKVHEMHTRVIPIVDENGKYSGNSITRSALISFLTRMVKPVTLGGLATPLGVYITDGRHQAGTGNAGLILTGFAMALVAIIAQVITGFIFKFIPLSYVFALFVQLILFIFILRLTPLVKLHAAEHQTINAIEKGLPLTLDTVKMQPRAHKRCGTNIMVLLLGIQFVLLISLEFVKFNPFFQFVFLIVGFLFIFSNWRKFGMWIQEYLTTANADNNYILNGIKAGQEILRKNKEDASPFTPSIFEKIWNMGLIQILFSFLLLMWIFDKIIQML